MTTRALRFGIVAPPIESSAQLRSLAREVEDLGYSTLLFTDHFNATPAPLIAASVALACTDRLRVGTQVLANPLRNPTVLAKEVTTLDLLSDGRFELGVGAGWPSDSPVGRSDSDQTGIDMGGNAERVDRLIDTVRLLRAFQEATEPHDVTGLRLDLRDVKPFPATGERRRTPVMIGGAGPRILRFAGAEADIVNIAPRPPIKGRTATGSVAHGLTIDDQLAILRESAGARYADLQLCVMSSNRPADNPSVTEEVGDRMERLAIELNVTPEIAAAMPTTLIGSVPALIDRILDHRERYDISYRTFPAAVRRDFAPVVAALAGR